VKYTGHAQRDSSGFSRHADARGLSGKKKKSGLIKKNANGV
jgi:hypothetical protein